jgi:hypothetical protein
MVGMLIVDVCSNKENLIFSFSKFDIVTAVMQMIALLLRIESGLCRQFVDVYAIYLDSHPRL